MPSGLQPSLRCLVCGGPRDASRTRRDELRCARCRDDERPLDPRWLDPRWTPGQERRRPGGRGLIARLLGLDRPG